MPGYCGGISLGDARRLDRLLAEGVDVEARPVLGHLIDGDMAGLVAFARDLGYREDPDGYYSKCHLCVDLRRHLVGVRTFPELQPQGFYDHLA
jgi:hypothetical protein